LFVELALGLGESEMLSERLYTTLVVAVIVYFIVILFLLKKKALSLKYTLLWIFAGVIMGTLVIVPDILTYLNHIIGLQNGIQSNMNGLFIWAIAFIVCILLSLTSIVSKQNNKIRQLIQIIARLEKVLRELEEKCNEEGIE